MVIDGNFKAEHLKMRNPDDDVALTDGDLYMVRSDDYERHLAHAKDTYLVRTPNPINLSQPILHFSDQNAIITRQ
jgi:hypothetical protein